MPVVAHQSGRTYTITTLKTRGSVWIAGGGKAMRFGRLNPGNRPSATDVIVGGTGAYRGARGTVASTEAKDVLRLLP